MLIGALSSSAGRDSARGLTRALETRHDGSILDDVGGHVAKNDQSDGFGILGHVLGSNTDAAAQMLGSASGIGTEKAGSLMATLVPVLLGALGRAKAQQNLGAEDLTRLLSDETASVKRRSRETKEVVSIVKRLTRTNKSL